MQSAPAIQFKGSGWYVTDYAGKSAAKEPAPAAAAEKKDSPAAESTSKESSAKDSKPAKKK
jgi:hypothetical protein